MGVNKLHLCVNGETRATFWRSHSALISVCVLHDVTECAICSGVNNTPIYKNFGHHRGDMHQDRSASNDAKWSVVDNTWQVDGQGGVGDDIGSVARGTCNYSKTRTLLNIRRNVPRGSVLQQTSLSTESDSKFSDGRSDMFVNWRQHTKLKVVSSDDQDFRNLLAGCTESWPSALSVCLCLSLSYTHTHTHKQLSKNERNFSS
jgi:hypothetical protein